MKDRFYVTDLDMTLARSDKTLTELTRTGIQELYENEILFTIATARAYSTLKPIVGDINLHLPIIEFNGGLITDFHTGEVIKINSLPSQIAEEIWQIGLELQLKPLISTINGKIKRLYYPETDNIGINTFVNNRLRVHDKRLTPMKPIENIIEDKILSLTFIDKIDKIKILHELLLPKYRDKLSIHFYENEYSPGWFWITIHDEKSTKGNAIKQIQELYSLNNREIVVFGDNVNDKTMFDVANRKYAVYNAKDELKLHATSIIASNNEDSVIRFILEENKL